MIFHKAVPATESEAAKDAYADDLALAYKGGDIEKIEYLNVLNYNNKGIYNSFSKDFKIDAESGKLVANPSALANVDKKGKPVASEGWVNCKVTYITGDVVYYRQKIKVQFK